MSIQYLRYRKVQLRIIVLWAFLTFSLISHSQEINVGLNIGFSPVQNNNYYSIGGNLEYRPKNAVFSINTDPFIFFNNGNTAFSEPIYLKFLFGKKFRFSPAVGGFFRTTGSYGWLLGLHLEYVLKDKFILLFKNEYYGDYWEDEMPDHFGGRSKYISHSNSILFSLGLKMMLKR